jgi:nicotinamide-nucleotide amidase
MSGSDAGPGLVVGLGNPGPGYADTRPNVGFAVVDRLAERAGERFRPHKASGNVADVAEGRLGGARLVLAKPRSYMNVSGGPVVAVLPGPPRELRGMWDAALAAAPVRALLDRTPPARELRLRLFGLPESEIAQTLRDVGARVELGAVEVITCLRRSELEVDLRHRADDPTAAAAVAELVAEIERRHGPHLITTDGTPTDDLVAGLLAGHRIGLAESCTGGLLAGRLTARPGSSEYVVGGIVSYADQIKIDVLGVPAELIEAHGAVSAPVARAMADGARRVLGADVGVGITGVAGPGGGSEHKPVGFVCLCVTTDGGAPQELELVLPGARADVRERSTDLAMHLIRRALDPVAGAAGPLLPRRRSS